MTGVRGIFGRGASPGRPHDHSDDNNGRPVGTALRAVRDRDDKNGRLGEASLPKLRQRKWLGHSVPSWIDCGIFFITINSDERGQAPLLADGVITCVRDAAFHYHGNRWWIHLWLIMPDHIHALLSFPQDQNMIKVVADWKRFVARNAGVKWQKGFFDHRLRHDESFVEKAHYIRENPVRAELVPTPEDWPHVWSFDGRDGCPSRPARTGEETHGRDGSPNRPQVVDSGNPVGTAGPAVRRNDAENGRLGEASLPIPSLPCEEGRP